MCHLLLLVDASHRYLLIYCTCYLQIASMQKPTVIVALNVEEQPSSTHELPATHTVEFELNREALETVIDGLGKIRDQLSKMG